MKNPVTTSMFALAGAILLGGAVYLYAYSSKHEKTASEIIRIASDFISNKKQLTIEEVKINLAQAASSLRLESEKLENMRKIIGNDESLKMSVAGAKVQAKIDAKRAALAATVEEWRNKLESIPASDPDVLKALADTYEEIIDTHMAELRELVGSTQTGLTQTELAIANDSIGGLSEIMDSYVDTLSEPPPSDPVTNDAEDNLPEPQDQSPTNNVPVNNTTTNPPSVPQNPLIIPIVINEDDIEEQEEIVDQLEEEVNDLEEQIEDIEGNASDDDTGLPDDSTPDLPPLPPQPRERDPNKPKLLQGSDL